MPQVLSPSTGGGRLVFWQSRRLSHQHVYQYYIERLTLSQAGETRVKCARHSLETSVERPNGAACLLQSSASPTDHDPQTLLRHWPREAKELKVRSASSGLPLLLSCSLSFHVMPAFHLLPFLSSFRGLMGQAPQLCDPHEVLHGCLRESAVPRGARHMPPESRADPFPLWTGTVEPHLRDWNLQCPCEKNRRQPRLFCTKSGFH